MPSDRTLFRVGPRDGLLSSVGTGHLYVDGRALDRHELASPTALDMLHVGGWRDTEAEAWEEAAARLDALAAHCRGKARALAPDTAPGTSASPCSSQTTPDVEARGAVYFPGEGLGQDSACTDDCGYYDGCSWRVYLGTGGVWHYIVSAPNGADRAVGHARSAAEAVRKMRRKMGWTAPVGEGVADA